MPWCEDCAKFWNPNTMSVTGQCPKCGLQIAEPQDPEELTAPWHFKLLVALAAVYLTWRFLQLLGVIA